MILTTQGLRVHDITENMKGKPSKMTIFAIFRIPTSRERPPTEGEFQLMWANMDFIVGK